VIQETYRKFQCQSCDFYIWPVLLGRDWSPEEVAELVTRKFIGPLNGFRSKQGRPFSAGLKLNDEYKIEFDFGQADGAGADEPVDFSGQEALGPCPKCASRVFEHGVSYLCEKSVGPQRSCDFRSGRMILQQPVERAQMQKLLATGRTDLLTNFMSRKNRKFKAFLVKTPEGKIGFEFQARAPKPEKNPKAEKPARKKRAA
jgi:DNA topoisomerase-3